MLAAAYLIEQGYEVFMGTGPTSCDILALKDETVIRVEVKAATKDRSIVSKESYYIAGVDSTKHDLLLAVLADGTVVEPTRTDFRMYGKHAKHGQYGRR